MSKKIVLVTGANKGIGFGIAKHLGLSGWQVIIGARDEQRATKAISELKAEGIDVLGWVNIELKDLDGIEKTAKEIIELIRISSNNYEHPDNIYGYGIPKFWRAYMLGKANANAR